LSDLPAADDGAMSPSAGTWMMLYEDLLAGIIHSMNNVVTVLGVSLELAAPGDPAGDIAALRREIAQLEKLIALTASLSSRASREEAMELRGVLDIALAIHALNPATRTVKCAVRITGEIQPVRVPRAALMRVLLLIIDGAKRADTSAAASVQIDVTGDSERVVVRAPSHGEVGSDARGFAAACGGTLTLVGGSQVLELPSLQRVRRLSAANAPRDTLRPTRASDS
jgi:hypothetical protein